MTSIAESVGDALRQSDRPASAVRGVVIAMAGLGVDSPLDDAVREALLPLGLSAPVRVESDAVAAFEAGTHEKSGFVLISGTGAAALRIEHGDVAATCDGLGWLLGDGGSGYWIGRRVAVAAIEELDGRASATALTPRVLEHFGIDPDPSRARDDSRRAAAVSDMLLAVYRAPAIDLAGLASLAFLTPGDSVAEGIIDDAAATLAATLSAVFDPALHGPVVGTGGVLASQQRLRSGVVAAMSRRGHEIDILAVPDGLVGAAVLALRHSGVAVDAHLHTRLRESFHAAS